jgi:anthranilate/para-aminobenzoate synthase component I
MSDSSRDETSQRLFDELHKIREDLHALREDFEKQGLSREFEKKIGELEIEERVRQIQDEIVEGDTRRTFS